MNTNQIYNEKQPHDVSMSSDEILAKKKVGDIQLVAEIIGVEYENARKILKRKNAKLHKKAITVLAKVITDREKSVEEGKTQLNNEQ